MGYKDGEREQMNFLPSVIDDYVSKGDPVRAYDAFVEALDFTKLGIEINPDKSGAEEYHPKEMTKLLIYGYAYGIRSSRKLERATHHNLSFMWLMGGLKPDYRTIARFRRDNKKAMVEALKQCAKFCMSMDLIDGNTLFVDGSRFRANASIGNSWSQKKCERYLEEIGKNIEKIMDECERIDTEEGEKRSLVELEEEMKDEQALKEKVKEIMRSLDDSGRKSINTTDPDCVNAKGRQGTHASYSAQIVVDDKNGLIVSSEAVSQSTDVNQFGRQVERASEVTGKKPGVVCSDSAYFDVDDLKEPLDKGTIPVVPTKKEAQKENGKVPLKEFDKEVFSYDEERDEYICPAGKHLRYVGDSSSTKRAYQARGKECRACINFGVCTKSPRGRKIIRLKEEKVRERLEEIYHSVEGQNIYKRRKEKAELPFGHIKRNLGGGQFLLRGKEGADAELSIFSICFNMARMITLLGIGGLISKLGYV